MRDTAANARPWRRAGGEQGGDLETDNRRVVLVVMAPQKPRRAYTVSAEMSWMICGCILGDDMPGARQG